jgi:NAD(P)-dependent dehydrogenase (short-subunit alcohol dehydrogenase family)
VITQDHAPSAKGTLMAAIYPDLEGRAVLVTGGASGIGAALVAAFARQGCRVGFLDLDEDGARATLGAQPTGTTVAFEACDLRDIDALQASIARLRRQLGPITVLVNNAARDDRHDWREVTSAYWDERIATNLKHQFFASQAVAPDMIAAGDGAIICMGSVSWMIGQGGMPCYTTAKSAVQGLVRALARDLGPHGVRVNAVVPGWIMTERQKRLWLTPEGERELLARQCLKRKLEPEEIAKVVVFMASGEAGAITNQHYVVDGGWV